MSTNTSTRARTAPAPSLAQSVWLVTERELASKLRSKAFVISTIIMFAIALIAVVWGGFSAQSATTTPIAVTAQTQSAVEGMTTVDATVASNAEEAIALVKSGDVDAALVPDDASTTPFDYKVVVNDSVSSTFMMMLSATPAVEMLDPAPQDELMRYFVAIGFGVVFLMAASMFGGTIAQSVVEEKQTRVVEVLISAVPTRALLAGKVLGNTILAMAQIVGFVAIAIVGLSVLGQTELLTGLGAPLVWFAGFFLLGFILLAALFAAAGAMVSRQEDVGSTTTPLTMLILAPYFLVIFFNDNPLVIGIMSYVPFSAPVAMPLRLFLGDAQWWEPLLSLAILVATCIAAILIGARIYENALLRMGARVTLKQALRG